MLPAGPVRSVTASASRTAAVRLLRLRGLAVTVKRRARLAVVGRIPQVSARLPLLRSRARSGGGAQAGLGEGG